MRSPRSSTLSRSGVLPGSRWNSVKGIDHCPRSPRTKTIASSAENATAKSDGFVATQSSDHPKIARLRLNPYRAEHPAPGRRLLQGRSSSSRKYAQRVRCMMFPPMVAMFRSWPDAAKSKLSAMTGKRDRTSKFAATSHSRERAQAKPAVMEGLDLGHIRQVIDVQQTVGKRYPVLHQADQVSAARDEGEMSVMGMRSDRR